MKGSGLGLGSREEKKKKKGEGKMSSRGGGNDSLKIFTANSSHPPTRNTNGKSHSGYFLFVVYSLSNDQSSHPDILNFGSKRVA